MAAEVWPVLCTIVFILLNFTGAVYILVRLIFVAFMTHGSYDTSVIEMCFIKKFDFDFLLLVLFYTEMLKDLRPAVLSPVVHASYTAREWSCPHSCPHQPQGVALQEPSK